MQEQRAGTGLLYY